VYLVAGIGRYTALHNEARRPDWAMIALRTLQDMLG